MCVYVFPQQYYLHSLPILYFLKSLTTLPPMRLRWKDGGIVCKSYSIQFSFKIKKFIFMEGGGGFLYCRLRVWR